MILDKKEYTERQISIINKVGEKFRPTLKKEKVTNILTGLIMCLTLAVISLFVVIKYEEILFLYITIYLLGSFIGILTLVSYNKKMNDLMNSDDFIIGLHYKHKDPRIIGNSKLMLSNHRASVLIISIMCIFILAVFGILWLATTAFDEDIRVLYFGCTIFGILAVISFGWFLYYRLSIYKNNILMEIYDFELTDTELAIKMENDIKQFDKISDSQDKINIEVKSPKSLFYYVEISGILFTTITVVILFSNSNTTSKIIASIIMGSFSLLCWIGLVAGKVEKEILTNDKLIIKRLFRTKIVLLKDVKSIQYSFGIIKLIFHNNNIMWVNFTNKKIDEILKGFERLGIFVEKLK